jgi:hypothetical protein
VSAHQPSLFDEPWTRVRPGDPDTSHAAAASLVSVTCRQSQQAILDLLRTVGPMTDTELIARYPGDPPQSESGLRTRRSELVAAGLVADSGRRVPLASGRLSIVWEVVRPGPVDLFSS